MRSPLIIRHCLVCQSIDINVNPAMSENGPKTESTINPLVKSNKSKRPRPASIVRISVWFVNNQKSEVWDRKALKTLHLGMIVLLVLVYACHVIGSPFIRIVEDQTTLTIIYVLESFALVISILCFVKMCFVNGSWTATKLLLDKRSVSSTYMIVSAV